MILVDTSVWIDYFNGQKTWQTDLLENILSDMPIIMGDLILTEILQGFRSDNDYKTAKSFLSDLPFHRMGGYQVAVQSAENYRILRKKGVELPSFETYVEKLWITTTVILTLRGRKKS